MLGTEDDAGRALQLCRTRSGVYMVQDEFNGRTAQDLEHDGSQGRFVAARLGFGVAWPAGATYWIAVGALFAVSGVRRFAHRRSAGRG